MLECFVSKSSIRGLAGLSPAIALKQSRALDFYPWDDLMIDMLGLLVLGSSAKPSPLRGESLLMFLLHRN